eukprot:SAG11_NODE_28197_length_324_cov_0.977778_1_plen_87_part_10
MISGRDGPSAVARPCPACGESYFLYTSIYLKYKISYIYHGIYKKLNLVLNLVGLPLDPTNFSSYPDRILLRCTAVQLYYHGWQLLRY